MIIVLIGSIILTIFVTGFTIKYKRNLTETRRELEAIKCDNERMAECILGEKKQDMLPEKKEVKLLGSPKKAKEEMFINLIKFGKIESVRLHRIDKNWNCMTFKNKTVLHYPSSSHPRRGNGTFKFGLEKIGIADFVEIVDFKSKRNLEILEIIDNKSTQFFIE